MLGILVQRHTIKESLTIFKYHAVFLSFTMSNYESIKNSLEKYGEIMIRLDTGEELELHKHNVQFNDQTKEIIVDAAKDVYFISSEHISYYWYHKEGVKK